MRLRCPAAEPIGKVVLNGRLVLRFTADLEECCIDEVMFGALWDITPECEAALDLYEGYPSHYLKKNITVVHDILGEVAAFSYCMASRWFQSPPATDYRALIEEGYADFDIPKSQLTRAVFESSRQDREFINNGCNDPWSCDYERRR